jgi:hypothetical protein
VVVAVIVCGNVASVITDRRTCPGLCHLGVMPVESQVITRRFHHSRVSLVGGAAIAQ